MSEKPTLQKQSIYGSELEVSELGVIGSGRTGEKAVSKDIKTLQRDPNYKLGYFAITENANSSNLPFSQEFNSLRHITSYNKAYLQFGPPEWSREIKYYKGSIVRYEGRLYIAKREVEEYRDPTTDSWKELDQITEIRKNLRTLEPKLLGELKGFATESLERIASLKSKLQNSAPIGMIYMQHVRGAGDPEIYSPNTLFPEELFGGHWDVYTLPDSGSPSLRYETYSLRFPENKSKPGSVGVESSSRPQVYLHSSAPRDNYERYRYVYAQFEGYTKEDKRRDAQIAFAIASGSSVVTGSGATQAYVSNYEETLKKAREDYFAAIAAGESSTAASTAYEASRVEAETARENLESVEGILKESQDTVKTSEDSYTAAQTELGTVYSGLISVQAEIDSARAEVFAGLESESVEAAQDRLNAAVSELTALQTRANAAEESLTTAKTELESAKTELESAKTELESASTGLTAAQENLKAKEAEAESTKTLEQIKKEAEQVAIAEVKAAWEALHSPGIDAGIPSSDYTTSVDRTIDPLRFSYDAAASTVAYAVAYNAAWDAAYNKIREVTGIEPSRYEVVVLADKAAEGVIWNTKDESWEIANVYYAAAFRAAYFAFFDYISESGDGILGRNRIVYEQVFHEKGSRTIVNIDFSSIPRENFNDTGQTVRLWIKTGHTKEEHQ